MEEKTIDRGDALALVEREENHFWDQKSRRGGGAMVQKIGVALANADGGEFVVGIEDRKAATGLDRWQGFAVTEDANFVLQSLSSDVTPPVPYEIEWLRIDGESARGVVCLVQVQKSNDVHRMADKTTWIRRGAASVQVSGQSITDLTLSKGARSYEDQVLGDYTADDLAVETELAFFLRFYSPATPPEEFIRKQRLVEKNTGNARLAGALLYSENPSAVSPKRCGLMIARYESKEAEPLREHLGRQEAIEGPARQVIDDALRIVTEMIENVTELQPDGTMAPLRYPPEALKEIVVNAVIHRDYNISDDIRIFVFDNRVEVRSPGVLPGYMTIDNLSSERFARNPTVVRMLNKYPDPPNKDIGDGITTVLTKMAEARLQAPKFAIVGNSFVVSLGHTPLARPHEIVLEYLASHPTITNAVGRSLTGIRSENAMKEVFYKLRDTDKIEMVPDKRGSASAWRVKKPG